MLLLEPEFYLGKHLYPALNHTTKHDHFQIKIVQHAHPNLHHITKRYPVPEQHC